MEQLLQEPPRWGEPHTTFLIQAAIICWWQKGIFGPLHLCVFIAHVKVEYAAAENRIIRFVPTHLGFLTRAHRWRAKAALAPQSWLRISSLLFSIPQQSRQSGRGRSQAPTFVVLICSPLCTTRPWSTRLTQTHHFTNHSGRFEHFIFVKKRDCVTDKNHVCICKDETSSTFMQDHFICTFDTYIYWQRCIK